MTISLLDRLVGFALCAARLVAKVPERLSAGQARQDEAIPLLAVCAPFGYPRVEWFVSDSRGQCLGRDPRCRMSRPIRFKTLAIQAKPNPDANSSNIPTTVFA